MVCSNKVAWSAWLEGTPAMDLGHMNVVLKWMYLYVMSVIKMWKVVLKWRNPTCLLLECFLLFFFWRPNLITGLSVVSSQISNLERKRGQYQDSGFVRAKRQQNVASNRKYLLNVCNKPCRGCGFLTFVTFLRFVDILESFRAGFQT